jgi:hypothetical protein
MDISSLNSSRLARKASFLGVEKHRFTTFYLSVMTTQAKLKSE